MRMETQWEQELQYRCSETKQLLGIAMKRIIDALFESCKNWRTSVMLQPSYDLRMGSKWEHVLLRQFCSRTQPRGIVGKANNHRLRVAGKH